MQKLARVMEKAKMRPLLPESRGLVACDFLCSTCVQSQSDAYPRKANMYKQKALEKAEKERWQIRVSGHVALFMY